MITVHGKSVTLKQLKKIEVVTPKRVLDGVASGKRWKGIQHAKLVQSILNGIAAKGWNVRGMQFALSNNHADMVGGFDLDIPKIPAPKGQCFSLGLMTSNSMRRSLRLFVGTKIFICNNGMATGEIVLAKKHTLYLNLDWEIEDSLGFYFEKAKEVKSIVKEMKQYELSEAKYEHILIEAGRQKVLPWSRLGKVDAEYANPRFQEFNQKTCWGLYNAFTLIVQQSPPLFQMEKMNEFRKLLPIAC